MQAKQEILTFNDKSIRHWTVEDGFEAFSAFDILHIIGTGNSRNSVKCLHPSGIVTIAQRELYNITTFRSYKDNTLRKDNSMKLITRVGLHELISKSRSPQANELAKFLGIEVYKHRFASVESSTLEIIQKCFKGEDMKFQFHVDTPDNDYRIDLYFPKYKLAIECDEYGHQDRDADYEFRRQNDIIYLLDCTFIRYNPHSSDFDIYDVINHIFTHISKK